jgi:restriction system protein
MAAHHGDLPLEQGFVSIGWEDVGDLAALSPDREAFKQKLVEAYPDTKPGAVPVQAGVLFRFACEMREGDLVIYPSKTDRMVNIGIVESAYEFVLGKTDGSTHRRQVRWLNHIPRSDFSQNALNEIGSAITLFQVSNNAEEFLNALEGKLETTNPQDDATAASAAEQVELTTEDFVLKKLKSAISPKKFEEFCAHLMEAMGYRARVTKYSGDGGVDVIAHRDELGFEPPLIKVQCKQMNSSVGRPDIQKLDGAVQHGEFGLFITLGAYSSDARTYEQMKPNLRLIDGSELVDLVVKHYQKLSSTYQILLPLQSTYIPKPLATDV